MHDAGEAAICHSKALGLWDFMDDVDRLIIPEDLKKALDVFPVAAHFFTHINPSSKRFVLRWLKLAKTAKTRQARIDKLVALSREEKNFPEVKFRGVGKNDAASWLFRITPLNLFN